MNPRAIPIRTLLVAGALLATGLAGAAVPPNESNGREAPHAAREASRPETTTRTAPSVADVANAGFETGDFTGWQFDAGSSDVAIVPKNPPNACFQPKMPSEGNYMACLSTGTFWGGTSNGGVRSDLTSGPVTFNFKPGNIKISFDVDFQTEESLQSIGHNDAFEARLVTTAGTFVILQIDTFGRTTPGRGLKVVGFDGMQGTQPNCGIAGLRTGLLTVTWTKPFDPFLTGTIARGPVFVEFSISNDGDAMHTSIACVDNIQVRVTKP